MTGPRDGEEGGPQEPVLHSTIDNAEAVHELIVRKIDERLG